MGAGCTFGTSDFIRPKQMLWQQQTIRIVNQNCEAITETKFRGFSSPTSPLGRSPIQFAQLIEQAFGGFVPPVL